jgi:nucleotide-binding universal stress UspA family protein
MVVPVASVDDARTTAAALAPYLDDEDRSAVAVHVVEKAGGALDKASVEQRERDAEAAFDIFVDALGDVGATVETRVLYGTDVADTIVESAQEMDATAIAFTPRGGGLLAKLISGDVSHALIENSDVPVLSFPD